MIDKLEVMTAAIALYDQMEDPTPKLIGNIIRLHSMLDDKDQIEYIDVVHRSAKDCMEKLRLGEEDYLAPLVKIVSRQYREHLDDDEISKMTNEELLSVSDNGGNFTF